MVMFEDFKKFAFKGNVVDLAVGVVIGAAFGKIVAAIVADVVMPIVSLVMPSGDWRAAGIVLRKGADGAKDTVLAYGDLLGVVLDFLVVAIVLFLVISKVVKAGQAKLAKPEAAKAPTTKDCPFCLETIPMKATRCKACTSQLDGGVTAIAAM